MPLALLSVCVLLAPARSWAKLCGDDVEGRDVPCACGDVVASDVVLGDDPVTTTVCPGNGLIVRAGSGAKVVTVDLHGHALHGSGRGSGVWLIYGGPSGARLLSSNGPALIDGFHDGVSAHGANAVSVIADLVVTHSGRDGIRVFSSDYEIRETEVWDSGQDGFWLRGKGFWLSTTRAVGSGRYGYFVLGQDGQLGETNAGAEAVGSKDSGFHIMGSGHRLLDCQAMGSGKAGVQLNAMNMDVEGCTAVENGTDGIWGMGGDLRLQGNRAEDNGRNGILVWGAGMEDGGGNQGTGNQGTGQQRQTVQCEIGGVPCAP